MVNQGPNTNGSQFYITLQPTPWMDKQYVAFGYVIVHAQHITTHAVQRISLAIIVSIVFCNWIKLHFYLEGTVCVLATNIHIKVI